MTIPKEIVEKMEQVNALMLEIDTWLDENIDTKGSKHNCREMFSNEFFHADYYRFTNEPEGEEQCDGEFCTQSTYGESGNVYGQYYYPTEKGNYFWFEYLGIGCRS